MGEEFCPECDFKDAGEVFYKALISVGRPLPDELHAMSCCGPQVREKATVRKLANIQALRRSIMTIRKYADFHAGKWQDGRLSDTERNFHEGVAAGMIQAADHFEHKCLKGGDK